MNYAKEKAACGQFAPLQKCCKALGVMTTLFRRLNWDRLSDIERVAILQAVRNALVTAFPPTVTVPKTPATRNMNVAVIAAEVSQLTTLVTKVKMATKPEVSMDPKSAIEQLASLTDSAKQNVSLADPSLWRQVYFPFRDAAPVDAKVGYWQMLDFGRKISTDPNQWVLFMAMSGTLSNGAWFTLDPAESSTLGLPHEGDQPLLLGGGGHIALTPVAWAAYNSGDMSVFHDPNAMLYARTIGVNGPDELLTDYRGTVMMLLWTIVNRRSDLLDSFAIGPINQWLGRTTMFQRSMGKMVEVADEDILFHTWDELLNFLTIQGGLEGVYRVAQRDIARALREGGDPMEAYRPGKDEFDYNADWGWKMNSFLARLDVLNRWRRPREEYGVVFPEILKTGGWPLQSATPIQGNFVGTVCSIANMLVAESAEMGWAAHNWGKPKRHDLLADQHGKELSMVGNAMLSIGSVFAGQAGSAVGGIVGAVAGQTLAKVMGSTWANLQAYVTSAWTSITHSPAAKFLDQRMWMNAWQTLERGVALSKTIMPASMYGRQAALARVADWEDKVKKGFELSDSFYREKRDLLGNTLDKKHVY